MHSVPNREKTLALVNPELWQLELIKLNPLVTDWSPKGNLGGNGTEFATPIEFNNWTDFTERWKLLDEYNHAVNYCFNIFEDKEHCNVCQNGYDPDLTKMSKYMTGSNAPFCITQEELEFYVKKGVIKSKSHGRVVFNDETKLFTDAQKTGSISTEIVEYPPLDEVNEEMNNMSINKSWIGPLDIFTWDTVLATRRELAGMSVHCPKCKGEGFIYFGDTKLRLSLWFIHPVHGASRSVTVKEIVKQDLAQVFDYLYRTWEIINDRFKSVTENVEAKLGHIESISGRWKDHPQ